MDPIGDLQPFVLGSGEIVALGLFPTVPPLTT